MKTKALSPVIATVLLIFLVTAIATMVFVWGKGFIGEQIEKMNSGKLKPAEVICDEEIKYDAQLSAIGKNIEIANKGNVPIFSFDVKKIIDGDSKVESIEISVPAGGSISRNIAPYLDAEELIIFPKILGNVKGGTTNKPFTCLHQGKQLI